MSQGSHCRIKTKLNTWEEGSHFSLTRPMSLEQISGAHDVARQFPNLRDHCPIEHLCSEGVPNAVTWEITTRGAHKLHSERRLCDGITRTPECDHDQWKDERGCVTFELDSHDEEDGLLFAVTNRGTENESLYTLQLGSKASHPFHERLPRFQPFFGM